MGSPRVLTRRFAGACLASVMALAVASCGDDAAPAQTTDAVPTVDDFLDLVDGICRDARKAIDKLDASELGVAGDFGDILDDAVNELSELDPPNGLARDFDDLIAGFEGQVEAAGDLRRADNDADTGRIVAAAATLDSLSAEADEAARELKATRCAGVTVSGGFVALQKMTVPGTGPGDTTVSSSEPPITEPPDTGVDTVPSVSDGSNPTPPSSAEGEILPTDLADGATAPPGYTWLPFDHGDVSPLYAKPNLGPLIDVYAAGRVESATDGSTASIFTIRILTEWTELATNEYLFWEGTDTGTDTVTPGGIPVKQKLLAFENTDCVTFYGGRSGITVCTFTGVDGLAIMDAFVDAQTS